MTTFQHVRYTELNSRRRKIFQLQEGIGLLEDFGFATYRLTDDWNGADLLAVHFDGSTFLRVQSKGRLTFEKNTKAKPYGSVLNTLQKLLEEQLRPYSIGYESSPLSLS